MYISFIQRIQHLNKLETKEKSLIKLFQRLKMLPHHTKVDHSKDKG